MSCALAMSVELAGRVRKRGSIRQRGRSFQVRVFAGNDVVTGRPQYLTETVQIATARTPAAQERAELEDYARAEKALTKLQLQVDGRRNARVPGSAPPLAARPSDRAHSART